MDLEPTWLPARLMDRLCELDTCDGYVVLVVDLETNEADAHGPYDGVEASVVADRFRHDFDDADLGDVHVFITRLHHSSSAGAGRAA